MKKGNTGASFSFLLFLVLMLFLIAGVAAFVSPASAASCSTSFIPSESTISSAGGTGSASVSASASNCSWNVTSDSPWLTVRPGSGISNGTIQYTATANTGLYTRTGVISLSNGNSFTIVQYGTGLYSYAGKWGSAGSSDGHFNAPRGIAIDANGYVYVVDSGNNRIQKFDPHGNFITKWGTAGSGDGQFNSPEGIAVDSSRNIYVVDSGNNRVQKFDPDGNFVTAWGSKGAESGQFEAPVSISVSPSGHVFVGDVGNNRIQKFDRTGKFLLWWQAGGSRQAMAVDSSGNIYLSYPSLAGAAVMKFDPDGNAQGELLLFHGSAMTFGASIGGLAIDISGHIYASARYVTTYGRYGHPGEVLVSSAVSSSADFLEWGSLGPADGQFIEITGLAVDSAGMVYAVDSGNNRVEKFSLNIGEQNKFQIDAYLNSAANTWLDTGIDVTGGEQLTITDTGRACLGYTLDLCQGPEGWSGVYNGCPYGSLVGRIGDGSQFCVGPDYQQVARSSGRLYLAYNDENYSDNAGSFSVTVNVNSSTLQTSPVYRFLNTDSWFFFYTIYESERDFILQNLPQYQFNDISYYAYKLQQPGTSPVYRFLNTDSWFFFYTIYESEKDFIIQNLPQYHLDGIAYYAYMTQQPGTSPVYRFLNTDSWFFFYTIYESERDFILQNLPAYQLNGVSFYAYK